MPVEIPEAIPNDPQVVRDARQFKEALDGGWQIQKNEMGVVWLQMEQRLDSSINRLTTQIDQMVARGETPSIGRIYRLERYKALIGQTRLELQNYYVDYAAEHIEQQQRIMVERGLLEAGQLLNAGHFAAGNFGGGSFNLLPISAVEHIVGTTTDGSTLKKLLKKRAKQQAGILSEKMAQILQTSVAAGWNPNRTAGQLKDALSGGLTKALQIARTEQLRAYRETTRSQYEESDVVIGYKRLSAKDDRVCAACLMADGMVYHTETAFEEHVNGRCTLVPIVPGYTPEWEYGKNWFLRQNEATQQKILGVKKWEAWNAGEFELEDVIKRVENPIWGNSLQPRPLKELVRRPGQPAPPRIQPVTDEIPFDDLPPTVPDIPVDEMGIAEVGVDEFIHEPIDKFRSWENEADAARAYVNSLSPKEREAVLDSLDIYTGSGYEDMNGFLRKKPGYEDIPDSFKDDIRILTELLTESDGLSEDVIISRGTRSRTLKPLLNEGEIQVGDIYSDAGFLSTSIGEDQGFSGDILFKILGKKGDPGFYLDPYSKFEGEKEWLFPPGQEFEILDIELEGNTHKITMRVLKGQ